MHLPACAPTARHPSRGQANLSQPTPNQPNPNQRNSAPTIRFEVYARCMDGDIYPKELLHHQRLATYQRTAWIAAFRLWQKRQEPPTLAMQTILRFPGALHLQNRQSDFKLMSLPSFWKKDF